MMYASIKKLLSITAVSFFVVIVLPLLYILEPFVRIRLGMIYNRRIGHMALNSELFLKRCEIYPPKPRTFYVFVLYNPCNRQLAEMIKRHLTIIESRTFVWFFMAVRNILEKTRFYEALPLNSIEERHALINRSISKLSFNEEEDSHGQDVLRGMGIGPDDWYVCFASRDLVYLNSSSPADQELFLRTAHRNCKIESFRKAAEYVANAGGFAVRTGSMVQDLFPSNGNPRVIDYATDYQTDFGDIYVAAKCRTFISANSGIMMPPSIMGVRIGMVNTIPFYARPLRDTDLFIPKLLRNEKTNELITFSKCYDFGFFDPKCNLTFLQVCAEKGLEILDNSEEEILGITHDCIYTRPESVPPELRELQEIFRNRFHHFDGSIGHGGMISPTFAKKYENLIRN
jgi:putative glycosyltransferase (TIGR04372 family)